MLNSVQTLVGNKNCLVKHCPVLLEPDLSFHLRTTHIILQSMMQAFFKFTFIFLNINHNFKKPWVGLWLSSRAPIWHAQEPRFNPRYHQLKVSGRRWCEAKETYLCLHLWREGKGRQTAWEGGRSPTASFQAAGRDIQGILQYILQCRVGWEERSQPSI